MDPRILICADIWRYRLNAKLHISAHPFALGREMGDSASMHNVQKHGLVGAIDCWTPAAHDRESTARAVEMAKQSGITGIGVYTDWASQNVGFHIDSRLTAQPGNPAMWGRVENEYVSIGVAIGNIA